MRRKRFILPVCILIFIILIFNSAFYAGEVERAKPTLTVLMFHMVTDKMPEDSNLKDLYITDEMFRSYCEYFKDRYNIVSLEEAYDIMAGKISTDNPKLMAFTFDDGYKNNYTLAYPILKEYGIKANINVITRYVDENREGYLSWDEIKEMSDSGLVSIGSHTYDSHFYTDSYDGKNMPVLSIRLPGENEADRYNRVIRELRLADEAIFKNTGRRTRILAYPYGVPPSDLVDDIEDSFCYDIQLLVRPGVNRTIDAFLELKRVCVWGTEEPYELEERIFDYAVKDKVTGG